MTWIPPRVVRRAVIDPLWLPVAVAIRSQARMVTEGAHSSAPQIRPRQCAAGYSLVLGLGVAFTASMSVVAAGIKELF